MKTGYKIVRIPQFNSDHWGYALRLNDGIVARLEGDTVMVFGQPMSRADALQMAYGLQSLAAAGK